MVHRSLYLGAQLSAMLDELSNPYSIFKSAQTAGLKLPIPPNPLAFQVRDSTVAIKIIEEIPGPRTSAGD